MSHLAEATSLEVVSVDRPFSGFQFAEDRFAGSPPIRKLFSLNRCREGRSLIIEKVPPKSMVEEENEEMADLYPDFLHVDLCRISFWKRAVTATSLEELTDDDCIGYALLKLDQVPSLGFGRWIIYEAVFATYPHPHSYVNASRTFRFRAGDHEYSVNGCLYAQQNGLNKTCAQVALRSICSTYLGNNGISYREINRLAASVTPGFNPSDGLHAGEAEAVLSGLAIPYASLDYDHAAKSITDIRQKIPYQKLIYSGIESGCGALVSFSLSGPQAPRCGHMIPFFGHTFNEDSWPPQADGAYFKIGESIQYIPSRAWTSSFIVHDDNFGANLCIPQGFLPAESIRHVIELLPPGWAYSGVEAEVAAADYFYSILPELSQFGGLPWMRRLLEYVRSKRLILRHVPISKSDYLDSLGAVEDWDGKKEAKEVIELLEAVVAEKFWMVEVSIPDVFSTNKRKLGEILLDAEFPISLALDGANFIMARFPGCFVFFESLDATGMPTFSTTPSNLLSHVPLFSVAHV
jgi:hypothetical protein